MMHEFPLQSLRIPQAERMQELSPQPTNAQPAVIQISDGNIAFSSFSL